MPQAVLVVGTRNRKKGLELAGLLALPELDLRTLDDYPQVVGVAETGTTFEENARLKASGYARQVGQWVLADDSGICVDALKGAPGVDSAIYAGQSATDEQNNQRLLSELAGVGPERRTAHYVCHVSLADPQGAIRLEARDECHGRILTEYRGVGGFGYDPLFELIEYHRTFGELSPEVKRCLSHRARALRKIAPELLQLLAAEQGRR